jgi:hypothetical protein
MEMQRISLDNDYGAVKDILKTWRESKGEPRKTALALAAP